MFQMISDRKKKEMKKYVINKQKIMKPKCSQRMISIFYLDLFIEVFYINLILFVNVDSELQ